MNMFARFDVNLAMTLRVIKETKRYRPTHGQRENSIPIRTIISAINSNALGIVTQCLIK